MKKKDSIRHIQLLPADNQRLAILSGQLDENLHQIERHLGVEIVNRGNDFEIIGKPASVNKACDALIALYEETKQTNVLNKQKIQLTLKSMEMNYEVGAEDAKQKFVEATLPLKKMTMEPRTLNQCHLVNAIRKNDICFGVGPSGTGKTFLAVACAVAALEAEEVSRIVLVRPAVEAGESLGFLPGDLAQKIDPYLKPLYDALYETMGISLVTRLIVQGVIEIAPLAFMRGRTLNDSFIILDEGQNSTKDQMKMFLTRIGFGSKAVITGDITQVDLPKPSMSGLRHAISLLRGIAGIQFTFFSSVDVVRHALVQQIVEAYEQSDVRA
ncbi:MAG: phosphate starvation-inducible protein PhoH [Gammaproteobacteria bacterium CG_4_10_14_0_8_um_filter_38_16]|nr:MAG: phosphate starvation-inducible protein PhoH [Gammaproteobacteria bacterium CG_4_10_14_0_8_um_filter_38_16]PJA03438.1 MAG: phosphate starvation-inducible protein PhoH [Gammaproteobacteria bacterium CG_4_10_14_0_2_um_filter_38_22]PJB10593.1 MAG: phosphate starvation-inducible protein PhoH [Gammaproteobacteria bacterium CG_4_9_14_3_um_filter_38_9]